MKKNVKADQAGVKVTELKLIVRIVLRYRHSISKTV
jgi:hypothetical protein